MTTSRLPGFFHNTHEERLRRLAAASGLSPEELAAYLPASGIQLETADHMIENMIGIHGMPVGVALNFIINGREVLIPMAIEEPSVIAGASFMAKLARSGGGFQTTSTQPLMIGQIQVLDVNDIPSAKAALLENKAQILLKANQVDPVLQKLGGGARDLEVRIIESPFIGRFMVVHLIYDVRDAMGANAVNTACESLAPLVEQITGGRVLLRILSNLADLRLASARCTIPVKELAREAFTGEEVLNGILEAWAFAASDPYRAATHNKGIMNGVDAVVIATGNDWRAVEAGAHAYAARNGQYTSLTTWTRDDQGNLAGLLEMPLTVGIVGGATKIHPTAKAALKLMGVKSAAELAEIIVAVGLAQNLAALRALASEGIQQGHMSLHARQLTVAAGATGGLIDKIARQMVTEKKISLERAEELLESLSAKKDHKKKS